MSLPLLLLLLLPVRARDAEDAFPLDGLPQLIVTGELPLSRLNEDPGLECGGHMELRDAEGDLLCEEELLSFHRRGATSGHMQWEKKPYGFKLRNKRELIAGAGKAKKWCLLTGDTYETANTWIQDNVILSQMFAFRLYEDMSGADPIQFMPVSLYYNGEYRGVYLLSEAVEADKNRVRVRESYYGSPGTRVQTDRIYHNGQAIIIAYYEDAVLDRPTGGFLIRMDDCTKQEVWFRTSWGHDYSFKAPDYPNREQITQIACYVQEFEDAIYADSGINGIGKHYSEYVDMDSLIVRLALDTLSSQGDAFHKSCFYRIDTDSNGEFCTKLISGPAWDYDGSWYAFDGLRLSIMYHREFIKHGDITARLYEFSRDVLRDKWAAYLGEDGQIARWIEELSPAQERNTDRWSPLVTFLKDENTPRSAAKFLKDVTHRYHNWYDEVWIDDKLLGVTAQWDEETQLLLLHVLGSQNYTAELVEVAADGTLLPDKVSVPLSGHTYIYKVLHNDYHKSLCSDFYYQNGKPWILTSPATGYPVGVMLFSNPVTIP